MKINERFEEDAQEGLEVLEKIIRWLLTLIVIIFASPIALIGLCKRKWSRR